jgi:hypothetical protein
MGTAILGWPKITAAAPVPTAISFSPSAPSIPDNTLSGSRVCTFTVTMSDGSTYAGATTFVPPNSDDGGLFILESSTGNSAIDTNGSLPVGASTQNITIRASQNGGHVDASLAITVTDHTAATTVQARTITNTDTANAMPAGTFYSFGQAFKAGDVPSGNTITANINGTDVPVQAVARVTHADGSLAWGDFSVDLTGVSLAAGATLANQLSLVSAPGSWSTTTGRSTADITTGHDFKLEITNLSTTSTSGSTMDGAGTWLASVNDAATVWTTYGQGPVALRVVAKAPFINQTSSAEHTYLLGFFSFNIYQKGDGSLGPIELQACWIENSRIFISDASKNPGEFDYDVALKDGATTIRNFTGCYHPFMTINWMMGVDGLGDWFGLATAPKLLFAQTLSSLRNTQKIPPYPDGVSLASNVVLTVSAVNTTTDQITFTSGIGANNANYLCALEFSSTGSLPAPLIAGQVYYARCPAGNTAVVKLYDTAKNANANGATGLIDLTSAGSGTITAQTANAPGAASLIDTHFDDTGERNDLGILPGWTVDALIAQEKSYQRLMRTTALGLGAVRGVACRSAIDKVVLLYGTTPAGLYDGTDRTSVTWRSVSLKSSSIQAWTGSPGPFNGSCDSTHFPNPVYGAWLMEGGAHLQLLGLFNGSRAVAAQNFIPNREPLVGSTQYKSIIGNDQQGRTSAWGMRDLIYAAFMAADGSDEKTYFQNVMNVQVAYVADLLSTPRSPSSGPVFGWPSNHISMGAWAFNGVEEAFSLWFVAQALMMMKQLHGDFAATQTDLDTCISAHITNFLSGLYVDSCAFFASSYRTILRMGQANDNSASGWVADWNDVGFSNDPRILNVFGAGNTVTLAQQPFSPGMNLADGDRISFVDYDPGLGGSGAVQPPAEITLYQWYYLVNTSGLNCQLATTPGGAPVSFTPKTLTVSSLTASGTTATCTTATAHGLSSGQIVQIAGANEANYNKSAATVTVTSATTFTYGVASGTPASATGTIAATPLVYSMFHPEQCPAAPANANANTSPTGYPALACGTLTWADTLGIAGAGAAAAVQARYTGNFVGDPRYDYTGTLS